MPLKSANLKLNSIILCFSLNNFIEPVKSIIFTLVANDKNKDSSYVFLQRVDIQQLHQLWQDVALS
jgi:hypothetical protein